MNQKGFANIVLIVALIAILVGVGVYFIFTKSTPTTETSSTQVSAPTHTPTSNDETKEWVTFTNNKYHYSFKHPQDNSVTSNQYATDENEAFNIFLSSSNTRFNVEVQNPEMYHGKTAMVKTMELPLKKFAQEIWKQNKENINPNTQNKEVGQISQTTVDGKVAYQFTLTGSYHDEHGGYILEEKYLYLFVENNGLNFMIWFPADDPTAKNILKTFEFIN